MNKKKIASYIIGGTFAFAVILGLILMIPAKAITISTAVVVICLSLATGLLFPNPFSLLGLVAGICMLVFPAHIVGIIFICLGIIGALVNLFVSKKALGKKSEK